MMKKWLVGIIVLVVLAVACVYIFIPKKLVVAQTNILNANQNSIIRYFSTTENWAKWEGGNSKDFLIDSPNAFFYNGMRFSVTHKLDNGLAILIHNEDVNINSILIFYSLNKDSSAMEWKCEMDSKNDFFERITNYKKALYVKGNMTFLLNKLHAFAEKEANLYQINIKHEIIKDTLVIAQKNVYPHFPTTTDLYEKIDQLKTYALANSAIIIGQPMMNVTKLANNMYQAMVAVPVNKKLNKKGNIEPKNLTAGTPMLSATVFGGNNVTANALTTLENYKLDHQFTSPAIPYEILITDRRLEADSTKWETKICNLLFPWFN